jgi:YHS domain-containing protein
MRENIMNRRTLLKLSAIAAAAVAAQPAIAGKAKVFTGIVDGVAVGGYDPVSYFSGAPLEGKPEITSSWNGAEWRFATEANKAAFVAAPEKYAPQYGGYCAFAVSKGATAKGDPEAWTVADGKLYLNLSKGIREQWQSDIPGNIAAADANWPKVLE